MLKMESGWPHARQNALPAVPLLWPPDFCGQLLAKKIKLTVELEKESGAR